MAYFAIKTNLVLPDESSVTDVWLHGNTVYTGKTNVINKPPPKEPKRSLLGAAVLGIYNTGTPTPYTHKLEDIWTDIDAQEVYSNAKPTCYLILGKPGVGAFSLGEAISKKYHCIHLCPRNLIQDEIKQESVTGNCLDFNMKHNVVCTYDTILTLLKEKIKSPAVQFRGYVVSGLPMTTASDNPLCLMKPKYTEEAFTAANDFLFDLIYNLKRKKPKPKSQEPKTDNAEEGGEEEKNEEEEEKEEADEEEEEEAKAELPKFILNTCSDIFVNIKPYYETTEATFIYQLQELFNLSLKPDVIINLTCPDGDVINKKYSKYINYKSGLSSVEPFRSKETQELRWPTGYKISDYENPHDAHVFNPKYSCRPPTNFRKDCTKQLCNYRNTLRFIDEKLMDYDPKQVIKLDGRTSIYQLMHQISERLILMDTVPVIIPEPLYMEDPSEDFEEFWTMVNDLKVIQNGDLSFRRSASPWLNRCPVELKKRHCVMGKPRYAVMMYKHVYLLSSIDNFVSFCMNPRPFLKIEYLEPPCRIFILGTKSSGKTMLAQCLSWLFDTPVTCYSSLVAVEKQKKYDTYSKNIFLEISSLVEDARITDWQIQDEIRMQQLNKWCANCFRLLREYVPLRKEYLEIRERLLQAKYYERETIVSDEGEIAVEGQEEYEPEDPVVDEIEIAAIFESYQKMDELKVQLSILPIIDDFDACKLIKESSLLAQYGPLELITIKDKPPLPVLGDEDVTNAIDQYIAEKELHKEIEPTIEEMQGIILDLLTNVDSAGRNEKNEIELYGKYIIDGFPTNPDFWDFIKDSKLMPDYTFAFMENREVGTELWNSYKVVEKSVKNYLEVLLAAKDPLISCKLQTKAIPVFTEVNVKMILGDIVNIDNYLASDMSGTHITLPPEDAEADSALMAKFTESIERFREEWDTVKVKLEEASKCYIEVELIENKTDIQILEESLLKLRKCYFLTSQENEDSPPDEEAINLPKDLLTYNNTQNLCETGMYCPFTFYNYDVFWEGNPEFSMKYDNKVHYFAKEEFVEKFQQDITKYQGYNNPFKRLPKFKICLTGPAGAGSSMLSKKLATELGLLHIEFQEFINCHVLPRHFKKVGRKYENPFTSPSMEEEEVQDFQIDEENSALLADIFSNEKELRRIIYNYYERGQPIIPMIMHQIIKKIWFTEPYKSTGFIMDGYPRLAQDVEDMVHCNCIPDLFINLTSTSEATIERLQPSMFKQWKSQLKEAKEAHDHMIKTEKKKWADFIMKTVVIKLIIEDIINSVMEKQSNEGRRSLDSYVFDANPLGMERVDPMLFSLYNEAVEHNPEPSFPKEWEKPQDMRENIEARLEAIFETDNDNIDGVMDLLSENRIKTITVDGTKPFYKVLRVALSKLGNLRDRNISFLEETYIVSTDIAELLLSNGFFFLSKFGRLCPVYIHENPLAKLNSYQLSKRKNEIFPIVHRAHIYFISCEENVKKFRKNPLKYITSDALKSYYPYPIRIGVIGATKSGKSSLAENLARRYNLICISRGKALRHVMDEMYWTELGTKILKKLNEGDIINTDCIMDAVQTVAIDHRTVTYGFVLDGFPATSYEAACLTRYGLYPNIVFDISASKPVVLENSQNEIYDNILKYMPPYSQSYIENRYDKWKEQHYKIKTWINNDYQNMYVLNGDESRWQCVKNANNIITDVSAKIHYYLANVKTNIVPTNGMNISNAMFKERESSYKNMCPVCLRKNVLRNNIYPVDKTGVVQFNNTFYWICSEHMELVNKYPCFYLLNHIEIPEVPAVVKNIHSDHVYENGICIVTYAENLPEQKLKRGTNEFAASYKLKTYLFCGDQCLKKFLDKPHLYSDITVFKETSFFPRLSLKNLPNLGYLEQTLANILTKACCSLNTIRPKYPGLNIPLSGAIYIALYLKRHNTRFEANQIALWKKSLKTYQYRSKLMMDLGLRMRSMENPFATYPTCYHNCLGKIQSYSPSNSPRIPSTLDPGSFTVREISFPTPPAYHPKNGEPDAAVFLKL